MDKRALKPSQFYNKNIEQYEIISKTKAEKNADRFKNEKKRMPQRILGPTQFWEQFHRQADALEVAKNQSTSSNLLCTFVYQKEDGHREFIVAHPEVYWWYSMRQPPEQRCSYEVIPEGEPCWLYFDLEFMFDLNPDSDGPKMTKTLIQIFCAYFLKYWGLPCDEKSVVNLDSTTTTKFSRHLIFSIKDIAFRSTLHVGRFVKGICNEIEEYLDNSSVLHDILSRFERKDLEQLFVVTNKKKKIFVDTGVYTRNRHFRIYKSTKWGKTAHLEIAPDSKHVPHDDRDDLKLATFLDSLISYFPNTRDLIMLEYGKHESINAKSYAKYPNHRVHNYGNRTASRFPELDKFVASLVEPGKIRLCKDFEERKFIAYEVIGYRYCANIGRQHKSNNVYWIADLEKNNVYQKCHDEDCFEFRSTPIPIPQEILFHIGDGYDDLLLEISDIENE